MPGGDDFYDDGDIDDGMLEMLVIVGLAATLAFLVYYRQQRQQEARRREEQQQGVVPQQQQIKGSSLHQVILSLRIGLLGVWDIDVPIS